MIWNYFTVSLHGYYRYRAAFLAFISWQYLLYYFAAGIHLAFCYSKFSRQQALCELFFISAAGVAFQRRNT